MPVEAIDLCKSFDGRTALNHFSAVFPDGAVTAVTGTSGSGKTTLLHLLLGLLQPDSGEIRGVKDEKMAAVFQENRLCETLTAVHNIRLVRRDLTPDIIADHLEQVGLDGCGARRVCEMSGGMKRRVALVRAVACGARLLMLDEPFKGLDPGTREASAAYLRRHTSGRTVILVTHDLSEAHMLDAAAHIKMPPAAKGGVN